MSGAGDLRYRLDWQKRTVGDDGFGNPVTGDFATQFTADVSLKPLHGGETVMAARLQGTQQFVCRVRSFAASREITTAWRAINVRAGNDKNGDPKVVYQVKSPPADPDGKRAWLEFLIEIGPPA